MSWNYNKARTAPKPVKGGIRGIIPSKNANQKWWARRWMETLEQFNLGGRMQRGRYYARQGQVMEINIHSGLVQAKVQGSRPSPYAATIRVKTFSDEECKHLTDVIGDSVFLAARLLSGEIPPEIEQNLKTAGISLFPDNQKELETNCTCADWASPCKHVAAVYFLLGEEFDRDPFLLFKLRGVEREALLGAVDNENVQWNALGKAPKHRATQQEALDTNATAFWKGQDLPPNFHREIWPPSTNAALPKRLGNLPFWRGEQPLVEAMKPLYAQATEGARQLINKEEKTEEDG